MAHERILVVKDEVEAARALRESEERYRQFFELCPDAAFVQCAGRIELINTAGAKLLGADSPEQIIGKPVFDFLHPDYHQAVRERIEIMRQGGSVGQMEAKWVRLDGTVVDVEVTPGAFVYKDQPAFQVIARDIRKRKRLEFQNAQITQLSHRLNSAATPKEAAQIIVETADNLLGWHACSLDLYSPEKDQMFALVTMDEVNGERQHVPAVLTACQPTPFQRRVMQEGGCIILRAKGQDLDPGLTRFGDTGRLSASLLFAPIRDGTRVIGLLSIQSYKAEAYSKEDLILLQFLADHCGGALERLRVQEALRESEERFHTFMDHSPVAAFIKDSAGRYVYGNPAWARELRRGLSEMLGKSDLDLWPEALAREMQETDQAVLATGKPLELIRTLPAVDGSIQSWIVLKFLIHDPTGAELLGCLALNITERKQAEEELNRSRAQLRSLAAHLQSVREEERIRIAREIHDELGQLLTGVKMDLAWMGRRLAKSPGESLRLRLVEKVRSMSALVDDMVDLVRRISAELRPGVLDDLGLVPAMEWQMREFQKRSRIPCRLRSNLEGSRLSPALGTTVFRIFQETLTNIARHSKATRVAVSLEEKASRLVMRIEDNGRGITEQELADPKSLGLAGMRERAMALGGEFKIEAAPGQGTTVSVDLPLTPP